MTFQTNTCEKFPIEAKTKMLDRPDNKKYSTRYIKLAFTIPPNYRISLDQLVIITPPFLTIHDVNSQ